MYTRHFFEDEWAQFEQRFPAGLVAAVRSGATEYLNANGVRLVPRHLPLPVRDNPMGHGTPGSTGGVADRAATPSSRLPPLASTTRTLTGAEYLLEIENAARLRVGGERENATATRTRESDAASLPTYDLPYALRGHDAVAIERDIREIEEAARCRLEREGRW